MDAPNRNIAVGAESMLVLNDMNRVLGGTEASSTRVQSFPYSAFVGIGKSVKERWIWANCCADCATIYWYPPHI